MIELIEDLKRKCKLSFSGDFEILTKGENKVIRYHSKLSEIGTVSSKLLNPDVCVADLLSFLECLSFMEETFMKLAS